MFNRKSFLIIAALTLAATANAGEPTFNISGALQDGYYGYSRIMPDSSRFVHIEDGTPKIYMPKSDGCSLFNTYKVVSFKQNDDQSIYMIVGNSSMANPPLMLNVPGRIQRFSAPLEKVTTANHVACTGEIVKVSE